MTGPINPLLPLRNEKEKKRSKKEASDSNDFSKEFASRLDEMGSLETMINLYMRTPCRGSLRKQSPSDEKNNYAKTIHQIYSKL